MKISELIAELEKAKAEHGDLDVCRVGDGCDPRPDVSDVGVDVEFGKTFVLLN